MELWEKIVLGILVALVLVWFFPGLKRASEESKDAPRDWGGVLLPLGAVVLFIIFLISTLR